MDAAASTQRLAARFDRLRERQAPDAELILVLDAGTPEESEVEVEGGWLHFKEHRFGEVGSIYRIEVTDRDELTTELMSQADRLKLNGVPYQFNYDPPLEAPKVWTLYATELKEGGLG